MCRLRLKCNGTRPESRVCLAAKRSSPFKSSGASVQWTTGSRGVHVSGSNAGYTKFRGSVTSTGYTLHSPVSPSLPFPCVTVCHHVSTGLLLPTEYCAGDKFEKNEMGGACSTYGGEERRVQGFGGET